MPDDTSTQKAPAKPADSADDMTFPTADLIARAREYFGEEPHVVAGALHGQKSSLALGAARTRIQKWLTQPVTTEEA